MPISHSTTRSAGATYLSVVNHAANHALGKVKASQVVLCHFTPSFAHLDCALNVFVLSGESTLALLVVEAVIVLVPPVVEGPGVVIGHVGGQDSLI